MWPAPSLRIPRKPRRHTRPVGVQTRAALTPLGSPQRQDIVGAVHLAQALHLHLHLIRGVWLQDSEPCVCFVAVGLQGLPEALPHHPDQQNRGRSHGGRAARCPRCEQSPSLHSAGDGALRRGGPALSPREDPPVVDIVHTGSRGHLLGPHPGQSYVPGEVSCPLQVLNLVNSQFIWR